jgi:hypothetical protein
MSFAIALTRTPFCSSLEAKEELFQDGPFFNELHIRNLLSIAKFNLPSNC